MLKPIFLISIFVLSLATNSCVKIQCTSDTLMNSTWVCLYNDFADVTPTVKIKSCNSTYICDISKNGVVQTFKAQRQSGDAYTIQNVGYCVDYRSYLYSRPPGSSCYSGFECNSGRCTGNICEGFAINATCNSNLDCSANSQCLVNSNNTLKVFSCQTLYTQGETCSDSSNNPTLCAAGYVCVKVGSSTTYKCALIGSIANGVATTDSTACASGYANSNNICDVVTAYSWNSQPSTATPQKCSDITTHP